MDFCWRPLVTRLLHKTARLAWPLLLASLSSPASALTPAYDNLVNFYPLAEHPTPYRFRICHSHGCDGQADAHLTETQWLPVKALFNQPGQTAEQERAAIAQAVALLERLAGDATGINGDLGGNLGGTFKLIPQQDCEDESANTTLYLSLLSAQGLLKHHTVQARAMRGYIFTGWPHLTAVIRENGTGHEWAVDSWFHDNGQLPEILPLEKWRTGWKPEGFTF